MTSSPDPDYGALRTELIDLGRELRQQPTPDLLPEVSRRIAGSTPRSRRLDWRRPWVRTLSVVIALTAGSTGVLAGSATARERVADWLGIPGITITHAPAGAKPAAHPSYTKPFLGQPVSLADAQTVASFPIVQPTLPQYEQADAVYVMPARIGSVISLVYRPRPGLPEAPETGTGLLLTEFRDTVDGTLFNKIIVNTASAQPVQVSGRQGFWIASPHELMLFGGDGNGIGFPPRTAANSLVWRADGLVLRIETALPLDRAIAIAESIR